MRLIGRRCKHGDVFSLPVLIGRGLDLLIYLFSIRFALFGFEGSAFHNAPLAQLVEQLTLNQWVPGSSP